MADFVRNRGRDQLVAGQVTAQDLNVKGSRQPKVNGLADDVRRQEIKRRAGKLAIEREAQTPDVIGRRLVSGFQRDHNVRIRRPGRSAVIVAQVDPGNRQADVVKDALDFSAGNFTANRGFDTINQGRSFLNPCAGMGTGMQPEKPGINARKEVLPQKRNQKERGRAKSQERRSKSQPVSQYPFKQILVAFPETIEAMFKALLKTDQWLQPVG